MDDAAREEDDFEADLLEGFDVDPDLDVDPSVDAEIDAPPTRFYCAGADRRDEDTGRKLCDHRAARRWDPPCPKCGRWYDCKRLKSAQRETKLEMTLADMGRVKPMEYLPTGIPELDKVLGGGVVLGKVILCGGQEGGGKTRLWLQVCAKFATTNRRAAFFSGEDDRDSVVQFCQILRLPPSANVLIHGNAQGLVIDEVVDRLRYQRVKLAVFDSAQAIAHSGTKADFRSTEQINRCCFFLTSFARQAKIAVVLIGQMNVDGELAGGGALKHGVDLLIRLDPYPIIDEDGEVVPGGLNVRRLWNPGKSRQGPSNEHAYLEMAEEEGGILRPLSKRLLQKVAKLSLA